MKPEFKGFGGAGMAFLRGLKRNNRREWFQPRKHIFDEAVRSPMLELVEALDSEMAALLRLTLAIRASWCTGFTATRGSAEIKRHTRRKLPPPSRAREWRSTRAPTDHFSISPGEVAVGRALHAFPADSAVYSPPRRGEPCRVSPHLRGEEAARDAGRKCRASGSRACRRAFRRATRLRICCASSNFCSTLPSMARWPPRRGFSRKSPSVSAS